MGIIDDNWEDVSIAIVEFTSYEGEIFRRTIVLKGFYNEESVRELLQQFFPPVKKIDSIDLIDDGYYLTTEKQG